MIKILITLILWGLIISCSTALTCGSDRLFTKGKEYFSKETFFWFEKPEVAFEKYEGRKVDDCELEEILNTVRLHNNQPEVISEECNK